MTSALSNIVVFDDSHVASDVKLSPITDLRAAFDIRTGALTTLERVSHKYAHPVAVVVPRHLEAVSRERHPNIRVNPSVQDLPGEVLAINGRWSHVNPIVTQTIERVGDAVVDEPSGRMIAARVAAKDLDAVVRGTFGALRREVLSAESSHPGQSRLISRPWHVRRWRDACLLADLQWLTKQVGATERVPPGVTVIPGAAFKAAATATIMPGVVIDCSGGPVYLDDHALIRPGAIITGPVYVGAHAQVLDRAVIRAQTSIGPWCKVAGEVGGTIFQAFSNKGHDGYLGDSYIGEWVNLGAGTTNSNLLNTYGEVIARALETPAGPAGSNERTGETFLGCMLGDHVKTAICTRIMTGSIVGTGTMHAATGPISGTVPAMTWATDAGVKAYRFDKFMEVARAAMARRKVTPSAAYEARLAELVPAR